MLKEISFQNLHTELNFNASAKIVDFNNNNESASSINYKLFLKPVVRLPWSDFRLTINKKVEAQSQNPVDRVMHLFGSLFENLELTFNSSGEITWIHNYNDIWKKWQNEIRPLICSSFLGEWVNKALQKMDETLIHKDDLLCVILQNDPMLRLYFSTIYTLGFDQNNSATRSHVISNIIKGIDIPIIQKWLVEETNNTYHLSVNGESKIHDQLILKTSGVYTVNKSTNWCTNFDFVYEILDQNELKRKISLLLSPI